MSDEHKSQVEQNAQRIIEWLVENRTTFEAKGVGEDTLTTAVGLTETDITEAVDHMENHEEVVRMPHGLLKAGRFWPEIKDKVLGKSSSA